MVDNLPATHVARVAADQATARRLSDLFAETMEDQGVAASAFEAADGSWHFALHFPEPPNRTAVRALVALATDADTANALVFEKIEAKDWVAASLAGLAPVEAGRFAVHGRHDRARVRGSRIGIEIEAALAFGTGHHGTTRGCLLALDGLVKRKGLHLSPAGRGRPRSGRARGFRQLRGYEPPHPSPLPSRSRIYPTSTSQYCRTRVNPSSRGVREKRVRGWRILDIGTGTGVLAIAAAKALRTPVLASDIDPLAVTVARTNARLNKAGPQIEFICAAGLGAHRIRSRGPFDIVLANILLGPLKQIARPLARLLAPGGRVVLSGLLAAHANAALAAYRAQGLVLERRIVLEGWATLVMRRPALPR
jgi:ribosomal protein L11 methyltransferase